MWPLSSTGYGSASRLRNGAALATLACTPRSNISRESLVIWLEMIRLMSLNRTANIAWSKKFDSCTPPSPL